ncbi:MAG: hypothetical protein K6C33_12025 [Desulfovibrio sp.]|nr:hypothetical protein [Desulfovibrio sp.]
MFNVLSSIFLKEYVKTRVSMLLLAAAGACAVCWIGLGVNRLFMLDHPEIVWYHAMELHQIPYRGFTFLPLLSAVVYCCCQFLPEMRDERMRISLHLPCPLWLLMAAHLCFGLAFLCVLFLAEAGAVLLMLASRYPAEAVWTAFWTLLPWCIAGIYAYLGCAWTLLEPAKKARLLGVLLGACVCTPLVLHWTPGAFRTAAAPFLLGIPLFAAGLFLPALHFRTREVQ